MAALLVRSPVTSYYNPVKLKCLGDVQIFKIVAPYIMLSACFASLNARLGMPPLSLFVVSLGLTDGQPPLYLALYTSGFSRVWTLAVMTMAFFFNITDTGKSLSSSSLPPFLPFLVPVHVSSYTSLPSLTDDPCATGSWLEIGQSITFFCIASLLLVWAAGICGAGGLLLGESLDGVRGRGGRVKKE